MKPGPNPVQLSTCIQATPLTFDSKLPTYWVAVKELELSYRNMDIHYIVGLPDHSNLVFQGQVFSIGRLISAAR